MDACESLSAGESEIVASFALAVARDGLAAVAVLDSEIHWPIAHSSNWGRAVRSYTVDELTVTLRRIGEEFRGEPGWTAWAIDTVHGVAPPERARIRVSTSTRAPTVPALEMKLCQHETPAGRSWSSVARVWIHEGGEVVGFVAVDITHDDPLPALVADRWPVDVTAQARIEIRGVLHAGRIYILSGPEHASRAQADVWHATVGGFGEQD